MRMITTILLVLLYQLASADQIFYSPVKANSTLQVVGNTTVSTLVGTTLNFSGNATTGTLNVAGNATVGSLNSGSISGAGLSISGNTTTATLNTTGLAIAANLSVASNTTTATLKTTSFSVLADSVSIGKGSSAASSALLDLTSTTKALLLPRMSSTQITSIASPLEGLLAFNTDTSTLNVYANSTWGAVSGSGGGSGILSVPASYTPTFTGLGTPTGVNFVWWRVGKFLYGEGNLTTGTVSATPGSISLPGVLQIDTTVETAAQQVVGEMVTNSTTNETFVMSLVAFPGTSPTQVYITRKFGPNNDTPLTLQNASAILASSALVSVKFRVPIAGWTASIGSVASPAFTAVYTSPDQTITSAGLLTLAHSLGEVPSLVEMFIVAQSADGGYSTGDILKVPCSISNSADDSKGCAIYVDATNVYVRYGSTGAVFGVLNKGTGTGVDLDNTKWKLRVRAWASPPNVPAAGADLILSGEFYTTAKGTACTASPCDMTADTGVSSVTRTGAGDYTLNFAVGYFSAKPQCFFSVYRAGAIDVAYNKYQATNTATAYRFEVQNVGGGTADSSVEFICKGRR